MNSSLRRRFRFLGGVSDEFTVTNGVLQGCPLSVMLLNALLSVWCVAVATEIPVTKPFAYADDTTVVAEVHSAVQRATDLTAIFAELTGQILSPSKSFFFATSTRRVRKINLKGSSLARRTQWKCLGARLTTNKARIGGSEEKIDAACAAANRVSFLPIGFDGRTSLASMLTLPKALHGCSVTPPTPKELGQLRAANMKAVWGPKRRMRSTDVVLTLLCRGHRLDPFQAVTHTCLSHFHRMVARRPDLHNDIQEVWLLRDGKNKSVPGPLAEVKRQLARLKWTWPRPFTFQTPDGTILDLRTIGSGDLMHRVREADRLGIWRRVGAFRGDMRGVGGRNSKASYARFAILSFFSS